MFTATVISDSSATSGPYVNVQVKATNLKAVASMAINEFIRELKFMSSDDARQAIKKLVITIKQN